MRDTDPVRVLMVKWRDSTAISNWHNISEADYSTAECWTVGVVLEDSNDRYVLANTVNSEDQATQVMAIPKGCVVFAKEMTTASA